MGARQISQGRRPGPAPASARRGDGAPPSCRGLGDSPGLACGAAQPWCRAPSSSSGCAERCRFLAASGWLSAVTQGSAAGLWAGRREVGCRSLASSICTGGATRWRQRAAARGGMDPECGEASLVHSRAEHTSARALSIPLEPSGCLAHRVLGGQGWPASHSPNSLSKK